ncbi:plasmid pRiA4b ORF-3 family protein [Paenibacillus alkaliterrae]|uniref:plasmid pRiA4b ORF-3 family protein n=1 Tax=Paenibacillus alkaliterrae TaxID=320909 RepID=UPI001F2FF75A|nr:plasmid pRiA4b ORF-3 family protein [Paenibacillus alkaliterrae]MCF2940412.1 plasmid pRiA4b ORF-3 family protein [Paenibacillus alkaliterrae]
MAKIFKITLTDWNGAVRGKPYRKIAVQENASLYDLAEAALSAFDFDMDHLFGFYDNLKNWARSEEGYELFADIGDKMNFPGVKKAKVSKVFHTPKQKMLLLFDYGDEWRFVVQYLEDGDLRGTKLPVILDSKGKAPDQYGGFSDEDDEYEP